MHQKSVLEILADPGAINANDRLDSDLLSALGKLPQDGAIAKEANDAIITVLYNTLPHPPATYIGSDPSGSVPWTEANASTSVAPASSSTASGDAPTTSGAPSVPPSAAASAPSGPEPPAPRAPWAFRSADGSGNNVWRPALGQAGRPYARDVESTRPLPANVLPDPGDVFDALLKSRGDVSVFCALHVWWY